MQSLCDLKGRDGQVFLLGEGDGGREEHNKAVHKGNT